MKTVKLSDEAWAKVMYKKYEWRLRSITDFLLALMNSQEQLQKCYWDLIEGKTTVEQERKALHYDQSKK